MFPRPSSRPARTALPDWKATKVPVSRARLSASRHPATAANPAARASGPASGGSGSAAGCRNAVDSADDLRLQALELRVVDDALLLQVGEPRELVGRAPAAAGGVADVLAGGLVVLLGRL